MRLLVKAHPQARRFALAGSAAPVALRPLMPSIDASRGEGLGAAAGAAWHISEPIDPAGNAWDQCHALAAQGLGFESGAAEFAEPDLEQTWLPDGAGRDAALPQSARYPKGPTDGWFRGEDFSGLEAARRAVNGGRPRVRIAHLDTGYDPGHVTVPARLRTDLARSFIELAGGGAPGHDATDRPEGLVSMNLGHGTATIALLAGDPYGGAAGFEVVPLRVADTVVLFRNSAIAAALDYVHALAQDPATRCDVLSMSMGGLASAAWADAVNALYEAGVVMVTAAGNNFGNLPVRSVVYPARFDRVLAACGVMADGSPYADLGKTRMAGCYGPDGKMRTAMAAFTPNVPWARRGTRDVVDQDGGGTSAATPQIAAAAALWLERQRPTLQGWQRVEAVRRALFASSNGGDRPPDSRLGRGVLRADRALELAAADAATLRPEAPDSAGFGLLRLLSGIGMAPSPAQRMLELEALQLSQADDGVLKALDGRDPGDLRLADRAWSQVLTALADAKGCSRALKARLRAVLADAPPASVPPRGAPPQPDRARRPHRPDLPEAASPPVPSPPGRRLRVFTFDPSHAGRLETRQIATATIRTDWETELKPGPVGEYVEVVDVDPSSHRAYAPVDLNRPEILATDGLEPSEGNPQFHQQMTYAVAMKTIGHFRDALGRDPLWPERITGEGRETKRSFVRRLRIYPHALREANAYYSPARRALLFGYFRAIAPGTVEVMPGGMVFTCLSHDIVAHETTHALLDGLHPRWSEPTNRDMPAFHEAFADLVALFQHFTMPDALLADVRRARGRLRMGELMAEMARQFGMAVGGQRALRSAIGTPPSPDDYRNAHEPHALGEVLVAAVFDAWSQVYDDRTADLFRLASGGTGVLQQGDIPHDLARRLAEEAAKLAGHFLNICIRALDYCPPVDLTLGEYLRALITADTDLVPDDPRGYRIALVDGFRRRGIMPEGVQTWSPASMLWAGPEPGMDLGEFHGALRSLAQGWKLRGDRYLAWQDSRRDAAWLQRELMGLPRPRRDALLDSLGLLPPRRQWPIGDMAGHTRGIEIHSVRPARRVGPDGQVVSVVVVEVTQGWQAGEDGPVIRGGCTVIWDRAEGRVRYVIRKRLGHPERAKGQLALHLAECGGSAYANYYDRRRGEEPFAIMHADH